MIAVIMCGGSGTRLWPISRVSSPKQFAPIFSGKSLFQLTIERNLNLVDGFIIVVNEKQLPLCKEQVPSIIADKIEFIIEPVGRNTAPAITLAALKQPEQQLLILASDHLIKDQDEYMKCVNQANELAKNKNLVTFGITPKYAETGYGYIEANGSDVSSFKEKPNLEKATEYIKSGNYYWNSGMFLFNASVFLNEISEYSPDTFKFSQLALKNADVEENISRIKTQCMQNIPADSIDYAVMEKSSNVKVVPSDFNWSDLGSFDSLYDELEKDENGNTVSDKYISYESKNNLILQSKKIITTFNVEDLIIVETDDALLIGKRGESQNVKKLLAEVKAVSSKLLE